MVRLVLFTAGIANDIYVNPESVAAVTPHFIDELKTGDTCIFLNGSDDPLIVNESLDEVVRELRDPGDD